MHSETRKKKRTLHINLRNNIYSAALWRWWFKNVNIMFLKSFGIKMKIFNPVD